MNTAIKKGLIGLVCAALLTGVGFILKLQWDMVQKQATLATQIESLEDKISSSEKQDELNDQAQWRLLRELNSEKASSELQIGIIKEIQQNIILPSIVKEGKVSETVTPNDDEILKKVLEKLEEQKLKDKTTDDFRREQIQQTPPMSRSK
jgi:hypothetical protein